MRLPGRRGEALWWAFLSSGACSVGGRIRRDSWAHRAREGRSSPRAFVLVLAPRVGIARAAGPRLGRIIGLGRAMIQRADRGRAHIHHCVTRDHTEPRSNRTGMATLPASSWCVQVPDGSAFSVEAAPTGRRSRPMRARQGAGSIGLKVVRGGGGGDAVASFELRLVERCVGGLDALADGLAQAVGGDADAQGQAQVLFPDGDCSGRRCPCRRASATTKPPCRSVSGSRIRNSSPPQRATKSCARMSCVSCSVV